MSGYDDHNDSGSDEDDFNPVTEIDEDDVPTANAAARRPVADDDDEDDAPRGGNDDDDDEEGGEENDDDDDDDDEEDEDEDDVVVRVVDRGRGRSDILTFSGSSCQAQEEGQAQHVHRC
jgi:transcription elongation factor SPT5